MRAREKIVVVASLHSVFFLLSNLFGKRLVKIVVHGVSQRHGAAHYNVEHSSIVVCIYSFNDLVGVFLRRSSKTFHNICFLLFILHLLRFLAVGQ